MGSSPSAVGRSFSLSRQDAGTTTRRAMLSRVRHAFPMVDEPMSAPPTERSPARLPERVVPAPVTLRVDNAPFAEVLTLLAGLRKHAVVTVGEDGDSESFVFQEQRFQGTLGALARLRGYVA